MKCLILGASGRLGQRLCQKMHEQGYNIIRAGRSKDSDIVVDLNDISQFEHLLESNSPEIIVNLVAMTNVDECERSPNSAYVSNVKALVALKDFIRLHESTRIVHISSDQVYSRKHLNSEQDICPVNVYGSTKYTAELVARTYKALILRTNYVGSSKQTVNVGLTDWFVESCLTGKEIVLYKDVYFSPLHIDSLCDNIIHTLKSKITGTFNLGCKGVVSKADFCCKLAAHLGLDISNVSVGSALNNEKFNYRPRYMGMNCELYQSTFGISLPTVNEVINMTALQYKELHSLSW